MQVLTQGVVEAIDVGSVNGHFFLLLDTVWRPPSLQLNEQEKRIKTPFILNGNNRYEAIPLTLAPRF